MQLPGFCSKGQLKVTHPQRFEKSFRYCGTRGLTDKHAVHRRGAPRAVPSLFGHLVRRGAWRVRHRISSLGARDDAQCPPEDRSSGPSPRDRTTPRPPHVQGSRSRARRRRVAGAGHTPRRCVASGRVRALDGAAANRRLRRRRRRQSGGRGFEKSGWPVTKPVSRAQFSPLCATHQHIRRFVRCGS